MVNFLRLICISLLFPCAVFSNTLQEFTRAEIVEVLENEIPELEIHSLELISTGWDNLVADINGEWIFRFPRTESFISTLEREKKLLARLHECVTLPIPYYEFDGKETLFVGYRKIKGIALEDDIYLTLSENEKNAIAQTMAQFISQMHHAVSAEEALEWGYPEYQLPISWIETSLLGTLSPEVDCIVQEALKYSKKQQPLWQVLIHNDLHGGNLVIDPYSHQINGIFDFSDAVVADYTVEFGKLYNIHPELAVRTSAIYAEMTGLPNPAMDAAVDFILRRATYILHARENGDDKREEVLIKMLEQFIPTWKDCTLSMPVK